MYFLTHCILLTRTHLWDFISFCKEQRFTTIVEVQGDKIKSPEEIISISFQYRIQEWKRRISTMQDNVFRDRKVLIISKAIYSKEKEECNSLNTVKQNN